MQEYRLFATTDNQETVPVRASKRGRLELSITPVACRPEQPPASTNLLNQTTVEYCPFCPTGFQIYTMDTAPTATFSIPNTERNVLIVRNTLPRVRITLGLPTGPTPFYGFYVVLVQNSATLLHQFREMPPQVFHRLPETELEFTSSGRVFTSGLGEGGRVQFFRSQYDQPFEQLGATAEVPAPILVQYKGQDPNTNLPLWAITLSSSTSS